MLSCLQQRGISIIRFAAQPETREDAASTAAVPPKGPMDPSRVTLGKAAGGSSLRSSSVSDDDATKRAKKAAAQLLAQQRRLEMLRAEVAGLHAAQGELQQEMSCKAKVRHASANLLPALCAAILPSVLMGCVTCRQPYSTAPSVRL